MTEDRQIRVGILMGSDSDWPKIQPAAQRWKNSACPTRCG